MTFATGYIARNPPGTLALPGKCKPQQSREPDWRPFFSLPGPNPRPTRSAESSHAPSDYGRERLAKTQAPSSTCLLGNDGRDFEWSTDHQRTHYISWHFELSPVGVLLSIALGWTYHLLRSKWALFEGNWSLKENPGTSRNRNSSIWSALLTERCCRTLCFSLPGVHNLPTPLRSGRSAWPREAILTSVKLVCFTTSLNKTILG